MHAVSVVVLCFASPALASTFSGSLSGSTGGIVAVVSAPAPVSSGGGGNGPIAGSFGMVNGNPSPAPIPDSVPASPAAPLSAETASPTPPVATVSAPAPEQEIVARNSPPPAQNIAPEVLQPTPTANGTAAPAQTQTAAASAGDPLNYWLELLLLVLLLSGLTWWVLDSYNFRQKS